ncbi:MAG: hypothetical protein IMZ61_14450 [Planctomycetes bacterium]|nr:hypothetical protein [Planctomycetota bacterium]
MDWRPIDTAPKDGTKILVFTIHGDIELSEYCIMENSHYEEVENGLYRKAIDKSTEFWNGNKPVLWMPLPLPPVTRLVHGEKEAEKGK